MKVLSSTFIYLCLLFEEYHVRFLRLYGYLLVITSGARRGTNTLSFTGCPTIQFQSKNMQKIRCIKPLNPKRRKLNVIHGNCRTACLGWGGRPQFDFAKL
jgi:hypothetical protein